VLFNILLIINFTVNKHSHFVSTYRQLVTYIDNSYIILVTLIFLDFLCDIHYHYGRNIYMLNKRNIFLSFNIIAHFEVLVIVTH
jgi:hypothetical protein